MAGFLDRVVRWIDKRMPEVPRLHGIPTVVENTRPDIATADVLARLDEALALIARYQPWRLRHLQRDLRQLVVVRFPCRGAYFPEQRACLTELTFLARRDISAAVVAASIVHEGMHARVDRFRAHVGAPRPGADLAAEERLCRTAELAFGRALPPSLGAPVIERALASLELADAEVAPAVDWTVARARQDAIDAEAARRRGS